MDKWYLAFCKPMGDENAFYNLSNQGFVVYRPMIYSKNVEKRSVEKKSMFPRYIFIKKDGFDEINFMSINSTKGVSKIVSFGGFIPTLSNEIIDQIQLQEAFSRKSAEGDSGLKGDGRILVRIGGFVSKKAEFHEYTDSGRVRVLMNILGAGHSIYANKAAVVGVG